MAWQDTHEEAMPDLNAVLEEEETEDPERLDLEPTAEEEDDDDEDTAGLPLAGPEHQTLFLPGDLDTSTLKRARCERLASFEFKLRQAHAYDFITSLKEHLSEKAATIDSKIRHARGTKNNIVAQQEVSQANEVVVLLAKQYNDNLRRMKALCSLLQDTHYPAKVPSSLKVIDISKDLAPANLVAPRHLGDSQRTDTWIFGVAPPDADSARGQAEWETESECSVVSLCNQSSSSPSAQRVRWVRTWANMARTNEEVNLLYADGRAAHRGFLTAAKIRLDFASGRDEFSSKGATAYGHQKAAMFTSMAEDLVARIAKATQAHRKAMEDDDHRKIPYGLTQKLIVADESRLDYAIVSIRTLPLWQMMTFSTSASPSAR